MSVFKNIDKQLYICFECVFNSLSDKYKIDYLIPNNVNMNI